MKINYFTLTAASGKIEVVTQLDVIPTRHGTVGEHLAYSILETKKFAEKRRLENIPKKELNAEIKEFFFKCMDESLLTRKLFNESLPKEFNFTVANLDQQLANLFILDNPGSPIVADQRVELQIPDCPFTLEPIKYGIKFRGDINWYSLDAAYINIFIYRRNISPMVNLYWQGVEEVRKFSTDITANEAASDARAQRLAWEIKFYLDLIYTYVPRCLSAFSGEMPVRPVRLVQPNPALPDFDPIQHMFFGYFRELHFPMMPGSEAYSISFITIISLAMALHHAYITARNRGIESHSDYVTLLNTFSFITVMTTEFLVTYEGLSSAAARIGEMTSRARNVINRPQRPGFFESVRYIYAGEEQNDPEMLDDQLNAYFANAPQARR